MAPEVFRQQPYNEKADIFSFGVLMYEVFGRRSLVSMVCCCSCGTHKEVCALFHPSIHHDPFYQSISIHTCGVPTRCYQVSSAPSDIVPAYPFPSCPQTSTDIQACSEGCRRLPASDSELLGPRVGPAGQRLLAPGAERPSVRRGAQAAAQEASEGVPSHGRRRPGGSWMPRELRNTVVTLFHPYTPRNCDEDVPLNDMMIPLSP